MNSTPAGQAAIAPRVPARDPIARVDAYPRVLSIAGTDPVIVVSAGTT